MGRGELPSGPVFVKVMSFPRSKDRVRYLLRPLPAAHEATWLRGMSYAKVPAPTVVEVRVDLAAKMSKMEVLLALEAIKEAITQDTWPPA